MGSWSGLLKVIVQFRSDTIGCKTHVKFASSHWSFLVSFDPSIVSQMKSVCYSYVCRFRVCHVYSDGIHASTFVYQSRLVSALFCQTACFAKGLLALTPGYPGQQDFNKVSQQLSQNWRKRKIVFLFRFRAVLVSRHGY